MNRASVTLLGAVLLTLLSGCLTTGRSAEHAVIRAKDKVAPALVHIRPVKEVFTQGRREEVPIVGSGFIISPDGYVVTNEHVAGESRSVRCVLYNKEEVTARVVGTDPFTDLAVLKLDSKRKDLPYVKLGDSANLQVGQTVLALGSPHGLARSVSLGIVSVTDRYLGQDGAAIAPFNNWIQTDAAINRGNSGGPLVNLKGEVIGVNARKLMGADNVGFAIPINIAKQVINQIIKHGRVKRSWLGLTLQEMTVKTDDPTQKGVVIAYVDPLSPCADIGIAPGDVLESINGQPVNARFVEDLPAIRKRIADLPIGKKVDLQVRRGKQTLQFTPTTVELSQMRGKEVEFDEWGFTASEVTPELARRAQLPSTNGIMVTGTQVGGPADNAGLGRWDVIITVDGNEVTNLESFRTIYDKLVASQKKLVLMDVRNIQTRSIITRYVLLKQAPEDEATAPKGTTDTQGDDNSVE